VKYTCSCNNFSIEWNTKVEKHIARQCACEYCKSSKAEFLSDPDSSVFYKVNDEHKHKIIKHGHKTAEFHECTNCGVIVVTSKMDEELYCVINAKALNIHNYVLDTKLKKYDHETMQDRLTRRQSNWCKASTNS
jgi:hypothetical protein